MVTPEDESSTTKTSSVYIRASGVEALTKAAIQVSYESNSSKQTSAAELARYLIDNYLAVAVQKLIEDSKKK